MKNFASVLCASALALLVGCSQTRELGKKTGNLFTGSASDTVDRTPPQVEQAIDATIADLQFIRIESTTKPADEEIQTAIVTRDSHDHKIVFLYTPVTETTTKIAVSTGTFGSTDLREQAWDTLRSRLGLMIAAAPPPVVQSPPPPPPPPANPLAPSAPMNPLAPSTQPTPPTTMPM